MPVVTSSSPRLLSSDKPPKLPPHPRSHSSSKSNSRFSSSNSSRFCRRDLRLRVRGGKWHRLSSRLIRQSRHRRHEFPGGVDLVATVLLEGGEGGNEMSSLIFFYTHIAVHTDTSLPYFLSFPSVYSIVPRLIPPVTVMTRYHYVVDRSRLIIYIYTSQYDDQFGRSAAIFGKTLFSMTPV